MHTHTHTHTNADGAGLLCLALTMLSWVISPGTVPIKKKIMFPCISSFILTCTFLIPLIHGAEKTFCEDEVTFSGQENGGLCFVQALLVSFFGLSTAIWWFCHIVHLFLRFVVYGLTSQRDYSKHWFYYAIAAYGIPLFTTSALVIGGTLGYAPPVFYCIFKSKRESKHFDLQWPFFYAPLCVMVIVGVPMVFCVLVQLWRTSFSTYLRTFEHILITT